MCDQPSQFANENRNAPFRLAPTAGRPLEQKMKYVP
jgi:hypothetical protein